MNDHPFSNHQSIESRLDRLERENQRLRIGLYSLVGLAIGVGVIACTEKTGSTSDVADSISAREFILVGEGHDGNDREIGRWGYNKHGNLVLDLGGNQTQPRVRLLADDDTCGLVAWSPSGYPAAKLIADRDYGGRTLLFGKLGPHADGSDPIEKEREEAKKYEVESMSFLTASDNAHLLMEDRKDDQRIDLRTGTKELNGPLLELKEPETERKLELGRRTKSSRYRLFYWDTGQPVPVNP